VENSAEARIENQLVSISTTAKILLINLTVTLEERQAANFCSIQTKNVCFGRFGFIQRDDVGLKLCVKSAEPLPMALRGARKKCARTFGVFAVAVAELCFKTRMSSMAFLCGQDVKGAHSNCRSRIAA